MPLILVGNTCSKSTINSRATFSEVVAMTLLLNLNRLNRLTLNFVHFDQLEALLRLEHQGVSWGLGASMKYNNLVIGINRDQEVGKPEKTKTKTAEAQLGTPGII